MSRRAGHHETEASPRPREWGVAPCKNDTNNPGRQGRDTDQTTPPGHAPAARRARPRERQKSARKGAGQSTGQPTGTPTATTQNPRPAPEARNQAARPAILALPTNVGSSHPPASGNSRAPSGPDGPRMIQTYHGPLARSWQCGASPKRSPSDPNIRLLIGQSRQIAQLSQAYHFCHFDARELKMGYAEAYTWGDLSRRMGSGRLFESPRVFGVREG